MIGLEAAQTIVAGLADVVGGQAPVIGAGAHRLVDLGRQDNSLAAPALRQPAPDNPLGDALTTRVRRGLRLTVDVSRVDEVDA